MSHLPVLWICGAPGAGKSTVAWALYQRQSAVTGTTVAYVDIDQLGMVLPAPASDPDRHRLKAAAIAEVMANARTAGADVLIVSGVIDVLVGAATARAHPEITFCRLSVPSQLLTARLEARGWPEPLVEQALREQAELSTASFIQHSLAGAHRTPEELAAAAATMITAGTGGGIDGLPAPTLGAAPVGRALLVTGPRSVGKSTVSWSLFVRSAVRETTGYVDLDQLGFISERDRRDRFRTANLVSIWRVFQSAGTTRMIINGQLTEPSWVELRGHASGLALEVVGLVADEPSYRQRIAARHERGPAHLAGDDLLGADSAHQAQVLVAALAEDARIRVSGWHARILDTSDLSADEVADALDT